jgi:hypothetical protein
VGDGTAIITVSDSDDNSVNFNVTIIPKFEPIMLELLTDLLLLNLDQSRTITISGGTAPYIVASSNDFVATATVVGDKVQVVGVGDGAATITVFDSYNNSISFDVTVTASLTVDPAVLSMVRGESQPVLITGGSSPYDFGSNDDSIATATLSNNKLVVTGVRVGNTTITITDNDGNDATVVASVTKYRECAELSEDEWIGVLESTVDTLSHNGMVSVSDNISHISKIQGKRWPLEARNNLTIVVFKEGPTVNILKDEPGITWPALDQDCGIGIVMFGEHERVPGKDLYATVFIDQPRFSDIWYLFEINESCLNGYYFEKNRDTGEESDLHRIIFPPGDNDGDYDVDGADLADYILDSKGLGLDEFVANFAVVCPSELHLGLPTELYRQ